jgi:hypothetical protein
MKADVVSEFDITAIITAHHEGTLVGLSLQSLIEAAEHAEAQGLRVERLAFMDRPNATTAALLASRDDLKLAAEEVDFGDQGKTRNAAAARARGRYVAFLDGDDLWSFNWLLEAYRLCETDPRIIAHPEFNCFFEGSNNIFMKMDMTDEKFDIDYQRIANYWDALCLAPHEAHARIPYADRAIAAGYAFEDWQWNNETLEAGYVHRVVRDTVHFKRRRAGSQHSEAQRRGVLVRPTKVFGYAWTEREWEAGGKAGAPQPPPLFSQG